MAINTDFVRKSVARFLAVQAAYTAAFDEMRDTINHDYFTGIQEILDLEQADMVLLNTLSGKFIADYADHISEIDCIISAQLNEKWSLNRINLLSLAILRTAVTENKYTHTPRCVIIDEYVRIASHSVFEEEINFVNGLLANIILDQYITPKSDVINEHKSLDCKQGDLDQHHILLDSMLSCNQA